VHVTRQVENVGPEENTAGGTCTDGETKEPFERGLGAPPEPLRVSDLRRGREQKTGEGDGGDDGHGEAVKRG